MHLNANIILKRRIKAMSAILFAFAEELDSHMANNRPSVPTGLHQHTNGW